jgi:hypothetical protein
MKVVTIIFILRFKIFGAQMSHFLVQVFKNGGASQPPGSTELLSEKKV